MAPSRRPFSAASRQPSCRHQQQVLDDTVAQIFADVDLIDIGLIAARAGDDDIALGGHAARLAVPADLRRRSAFLARAADTDIAARGDDVGVLLIFEAVRPRTRCLVRRRAGRRGVAGACVACAVACRHASAKAGKQHRQQPASGGARYATAHPLDRCGRRPAEPGAVANARVSSSWPNGRTSTIVGPLHRASRIAIVLPPLRRWIRTDCHGVRAPQLAGLNDRGDSRPCPIPAGAPVRCGSFPAQRAPQAQCLVFLFAKDARSRRRRCAEPVRDAAASGRSGGEAGSTLDLYVNEGEKVVSNT